MGRRKSLDKPALPRRRKQRRELQKKLRKFQIDSEEMDGYYVDDCYNIEDDESEQYAEEPE